MRYGIYPLSVIFYMEWQVVWWFLFKGEKGKLRWGNVHFLKKNVIDPRQYFYYIFKITNRCWLILTGFQRQWPTKLILTMVVLTVLVIRVKRCHSSGFLVSFSLFFSNLESQEGLNQVFELVTHPHIPVSFPSIPLETTHEFNPHENPQLQKICL